MIDECLVLYQTNTQITDDQDSALTNAGIQQVNRAKIEVNLRLTKDLNLAICLFLTLYSAIPISRHKTM